MSDRRTSMPQQPTLRMCASRSKGTFKTFFRFPKSAYGEHILDGMEFTMVPDNCRFDASPHMDTQGLLVFRIKDMNHVVRKDRDCYTFVANGTCGEGVSYMDIHGFFTDKRTGSTRAFAEVIK